MANRKLTISLPEEVVVLARLIAKQRHISVSQLLADLITELVEREREHEADFVLARERSLARLEQGFHLGTGGRSRGTRAELHDRKL